MIEAQKLGVGATTLEAAVSARGISSRRAERAEAARIFGSVRTARAEFHADHEGLAELESALVAAKIIAYAQGYATLAEASKEFGWNLPLGQIARIWRAGCIIRSRFLDDITRAYAAGDVVNLLLAPSFTSRIEGPRRRCGASSPRPRSPAFRCRRCRRRSPISTTTAGRAAPRTSRKASATSSAPTPSAASTARASSTTDGRRPKGRCHLSQRRSRFVN